MSLLVKGVSNFLGLSDTPASFVGQANRLTRVNAGESALEMADISMVQYDIWDTFIQTWHAELLENWAQNVLGTGTVTYADEKLTLQTGVNAGSYARVSQAIEWGAVSGRINWAKPFWMQAILEFNTGGGANNRYAVMAMNAANQVNQLLSDKGLSIMFTRSGLALEGQSHSGGARSTVALGGMPMAGGVYSWTVLRIQFYPGDRVEFWVMDGDVMVKKGEITTNLPVGTDNSTTMQFLSYNGAVAANMLVRVCDVRIAQGFG